MRVAAGERPFFTRVTRGPVTRRPPPLSDMVTPHLSAMVTELENLGAD